MLEGREKERTKVSPRRKRVNAIEVMEDSKADSSGHSQIVTSFSNSLMTVKV